MPGHAQFGHFGAFPFDTAALEGEDLEQALVSWLNNDETVDGIVEGRVYPVNRPRSSILPDLMYQFVLGDSPPTLISATTITRSTIRLTVRSRVLSDCVLVRNSVRQLHGFQGWLGSVRVFSCKFSDAEDDFASPVQGSDLGTYERRFDLTFRYRETLA
jgi:hypothetical protein